MNTLFIDTSSNKEIIVGLIINGKEFLIRQNIAAQKAQIALPLIDKLLKKNNLKISDISSIKVNTGPGSFTGLKVGVAIANALSYVAKIPVNGEKIGVFVTPKYE